MSQGREGTADAKAEVPSLQAVAGDSETSDSEAPTAPRWRFATVYDAVAGRLSTRDDAPLISQTSTPGPPVREPRAARHSTRNTILAPEEVLFRRKDAPLRWPHHDIYMSHERDLPDGGRDVLPSSDLLKAVHSYSSQFYDALGVGARREAHFVGGRNISERSMDETALLAFGILLEEAGREVLGARGHMVFTEGEEIAPRRRSRAGGVSEEVGLSDLELDSGSEEAAFGRRAKRRKVSRTVED